MLQRLITYLFPPKKLIHNLPLAPRRYSSKLGERTPEELKEVVFFLQAWGLARTEADAMRLVRKYPGKSIKEIRKAEARERRRFDRWKMFKSRLKRLWDG